MEKKIYKIVVTGGPCAGKTTAMTWIQSTFEEKGYKVLFVPETATELITGGITPLTCKNERSFQKFVLRIQKNKEKIFKQAAKNMPDEKVLIVCDRGLLDGEAFLEQTEFQELLIKEGMNETTIGDQYDAVFHLVTAAKGAEEFYTLENNQARTETVDQAKTVDDKLIAAWTGHPHFRVIDNSTGFKDKMLRLVTEISNFLGEPQPYEIERKFLIDYPDIEKLEKLPTCQRVEIIQTYLTSQDGNETRIRQRGMNGNYIYTQTTKKKVNETKRVETERRLTEKEYLTKLMQADPNCKPIRKTRYCLTYDNQYFEIDVYPFCNDKAIMEIELSKENEIINFPDFISVIKEVTEDKGYKNYALAHTMTFSGVEPNNDGTEHWIYETGKEAMNSSESSNTFRTINEKTALSEMAREERNYLIRYKKRNGQVIARQIYDAQGKAWVDD